MTDAPRRPYQLARRTVLGGGAGLAVASALGVFRALPVFGQEPSPAAPEPTIHDTTAWGARPPSSPVQVLDHRPTTIIVHHTATPNSTDYSQSAAFALARSIQNFHMDTRGWIDTGQQYTISRGGYVMEGRHRSLEVLRGGTQHVLGAHVGNHNTYFLGIENQGTYITEAPTQSLWDSLVALVAHMCTQYGIPASMIHGHRDYNATQCPGDVLYSMLPQLRQEVADLIGDPDPDPDPEPVEWPTLRRRDEGEAVRTVQYLLRQRGYDIEPDGVFWRATDGALRQFQTASGVRSDGIVGEQTWLILIVTVRNGSQGEAVRGVQSQLNQHGAALATDGAFGPLTQAAVRGFQTAQRLTADGVVGPITWRHLVGA